MPPGTPYPSSRQRMTPTTRTARPVMGSGRPVRVDLTGGSAFGAGANTGWDLDAPTGGQSLPLSDMVDRAAAQVLILRKAVDEAAAADRAVRLHASELVQRLSQGERFAADFDQRMARAGKAAGVVEKAAAALGALETVVQQVRAAQEAVVKTFDSKLAIHEKLLDERLAEQAAAFEARVARQQEAFERRMADLSSSFDAAMARTTRDADEARFDADRLLSEHRKAIKNEAEQVCAIADRHVAQAQARASLILDGVADRIDVLGQQCERIGTEAQDHIDVLCERAATVLGHDPRSDYASEPKTGSLAAAAARADALITGVDEAAIRIAALRDDSESVLRRLAAERQEALRATDEHQPRLEALRETIEQATRQARDMQGTLDDAVRGQADAADKSAQASMLLSRQREDLQAIADAGRYHVEQCRAAERTLQATIDAAGGRTAELERAVAEVRAQAESMVALARDAAALVAQARALPLSGSETAPGAHG